MKTAEPGVFLSQETVRENKTSRPRKSQGIVLYNWQFVIIWSRKSYFHRYRGILKSSSCGNHAEDLTAVVLINQKNKPVVILLNDDMTQCFFKVAIT